MKTITRLLILCLAVAGAVSCEKTPDAAPLSRPVYDGPDANQTIAGLKEFYGDQLADWNSTALIEYEFIIKAVVIGNDASGNVYKQLYVRDDTGAINIGIDQNSIYTDYRVGQTVYINAHNLYLVNYGGELQIGYTGDGISANRIPWEIFTEKVLKDDFPNELNAEPVEMTFSELQLDDVNKLVRFNRVYFLLGGTGTTFADGENYGERFISDGSSTQIMVRTSAYSDFAKELLPSGGGDIIALLGRYNGVWQLVLRDTDDLLNFGGPIPDPPQVEGLLFEETFGQSWREGTSGTLIKTFAEFSAEDRFDMKAPIVYTTGSDPVDFRCTNSYDNPHVWFSANYEKSFQIDGIEAGYENMVLTYDLAANSDGASYQGVRIRADGVDVALESGTFTSSNSFATLSANLPDGTQTIEFYSNSSTNTVGYRLDNIKITVGGDPVTTLPPSGGDGGNGSDGGDGGDGSGTEFFKETFGTGTYTDAATRLKIAAFTDFDMGSPVAYSDPTERTDIRSTNTMNAHAWFPTVTGTGTDASLIISGIDTGGYGSVTLTFELATGLSTSAVSETDLSVMQLRVDGTAKQLPGTPVSVGAGDNNKFYKFTVTDVPSKENLQIEFFTDATNISGIRLDNIILTGTAQ